MVRFHGREWTRQELLASAGNMSQIAGIQSSAMTDGQERGSRLLGDFQRTLCLVQR